MATGRVQALADAWAADRLDQAEAALDRSRRTAEAAHACQQPIQALRLFLHAVRRRLPEPRDAGLIDQIELAVDGIQEQVRRVAAAGAGTAATVTLSFGAGLLIARLAHRLAPLGRVRAVPSGLRLASDPGRLLALVADAAQAWSGVESGEDAVPVRLVLGCRRGRRRARLLLAGRPIPPPRRLTVPPPPGIDVDWRPERGRLAVMVPLAR